MLPEPPPPDLHQAIRALLLAARAQVRQTVNTAMVQTLGCKEKSHISKLDAKDFFRDPYVLEFLGAPAVPALYEKDLEQGLLDQLQTFLLELGKGFAFVARQKYVRVEGEDCFIDLVFYNYLLKCFVLVDLKVGKLAHQDVGQMDMYVRVFDEQHRQEGDNPTLGLILCSERNAAVAKYSLLADKAQLFASKYQAVMPTEAELQAGIEFLTAVGEKCSASRQEFVLLADVLGLSTLTVAMNHDKPEGCTEATVFGPFHVEGAPHYELGADVANGAKGEPCWVHGQVRSADGTLIAGAELQVWQADADGFYDVQYNGLCPSPCGTCQSTQYVPPFPHFFPVSICTGTS